MNREYTSITERDRVDEHVWKVSIETLKTNGYNLDIKNPYIKEEEVTHTTAELLELLHQSFIKSDTLLAELKEGLR